IERTNDKIAENPIVADISNPFNCIQFNKPTVSVSNGDKSNIRNNTNDEIISEFISVKATISPGISANSYIEVERLQKLLISRKDDIDCILKSQPVYAIGIDFQKNSTSPCIACWVAKPIEIPILECLETMFDDQFEVIYRIVKPLDINDSNDNELLNNDYDGRILGDNKTTNYPFSNDRESLKKRQVSNSNDQYNDNDNDNDGHGNNNGNDGCSSNNSADGGGSDNNNNSDGGNSNNGSNGNGDSNGGGIDGGNISNDNKNKKIIVDSNVNAEVINLDIVQDFNITANIWANTAPFEEDVGILNYEIDVYGCGIGDMLSNNWPLLKKLGCGYFLHSIEVNISPLPEKKRNFTLKGISQPTQSNREIEFLTANEKNINLQVGTSSGSIAGGIKKANNTKFSSNEWKLSYKGPITKGERWLYQYVDNNHDKDSSNRGSFAPGLHSGQWLTKKEMQGFCITITQILRCEVTHGRRRFMPQTKPNLLQLCPMMSHSLKITFNDLKDFNANLTKLNKTLYTNNDNIYINVGGNEVVNIENDENQKIKNLNGEIKRSFVIL
ncbi:13910_t:CDS:2, partial [Funneliformis caledonium]